MVLIIIIPCKTLCFTFKTFYLSTNEAFEFPTFTKVVENKTVSTSIVLVLCVIYDLIKSHVAYNIFILHWHLKRF